MELLKVVFLFNQNIFFSPHILTVKIFTELFRWEKIHRNEEFPLCAILFDQLKYIVAEIHGKVGSEDAVKYCSGNLHNSKLANLFQRNILGCRQIFDSECCFSRIKVCFKHSKLFCLSLD